MNIPIIFNYKICDQAKECTCIPMCPTHAIYWNNKRKRPEFNKTLCVNCGKCKDSCSVGAMIFCETNKDLEKTKKEIRKDKRKRNDLLVDRYGAMPIHKAYYIPEKAFVKEVLESNRLTFVELFVDESINCLLHSIPFKTLMKGLPDMKFRKIKIVEDKDILKKYGIKELPALIFFNNGKFIGKIQGYYDEKRTKELKDRIRKMLIKIEK